MACLAVTALTGGLSVDHGRSLFVGDAAGRTFDHSGTDFGLAFNAGIRFSTPEQFYGFKSGASPCSLGYVHASPRVHLPEETLLAVVGTPGGVPLGMVNAQPREQDLDRAAGSDGDAGGPESRDLVAALDRLSQAARRSRIPGGPLPQATAREATAASFRHILQKLRLHW